MKFLKRDAAQVPPAQTVQAPFALLLVFLFSFLALFLSGAVRSASAAEIWACNSTGSSTDSFYDNGTVYLTSTNITSTTQQIRIYIVSNNDSWVDGTMLSDASTGYRELSTNSSGLIPITAIWTRPRIGKYDVVADINRDGVYNSSIDFVDNVSVVGFDVTAAPKPTLTIAVGSASPASHEWNLATDTGYNVMLQFNATASSIQSVSIYTLFLTASGTGDEKTDVRVVYLVADSNNNGVYDTGETMLGYKSYSRDDGVVDFDIANGYGIPANSSRAFLIAYEMKNGAVGSTYKFDIVSITANSSIGENAVIYGLPLGSAIKTISGTAQTTSTTAAATTTSILTDECQSDEDCGGIKCEDMKKTTYSCKTDANKGVKVCAANIETVLCCADGDCVEGYYCLDYNCARQGGGLPLIGLGDMQNYTWTIVSIVAVVGGAILVFILIKNRKRTQWKTKGDYEKEWTGLRSKWKK